MSLNGYKLKPTGKGEWMGVFGGSEAHWADQGHAPASGFRWVTACGRLVQPAHFHHYGSGLNPTSTTSQYDGRPKCAECVAARTPEEEGER